MKDVCWEVRVRIGSKVACGDFLSVEHPGSGPHYFRIAMCHVLTKSTEFQVITFEFNDKRKKRWLD